MQDFPHFDSEAEAIAFFTQLQPISPPELIGLWKGSTIATGHPLDGALESLGWYGKRFHADRRADALVFSTGSRRLVPLDPARIPLGLALQFSGLAKRQWFRNLFSYALKALWARGSVASVGMASFEGIESAAMTYDAQPIVDHFRRVDDDRLMGVMEIKEDPRHYVFLLQRSTELNAAGAAPSASAGE